ncbi:glycosyl hydrolase family 2 [Mucilaginibacter gracilis]|uniref:Glycosyl hydrolase family 2 n=1 Tax=Mucilaginibacter gracilis TaxID=423350 RepID=A0A495ITZ4_9SPHI|nr:sugar-binding domain-containing protein [Mucilaginibacter gracilis]RKR80003.1 glycosyl hydrolase family 2 [Mucilaginibacter gracilis]
MIARKILLLAVAMTVFAIADAQYISPAISIQTRWAKDVSPTNALKEYPRPQFVRSNWTNLNGLWNYAVTMKDAEKPLGFRGEILVPYPIESALSGVKKALQPDENLWYKRTFTTKNKGRTLLHFGAVDWQATVFVNGKEAGQHTGGYTAFTLDITDKLKTGNNELMVKVYDPSDQGIGPHGKQVLNPQNIYYTPTSGIWQTVWIEEVSETYITDLKLTPDIDKKELAITVNQNQQEEGLEIEAIVFEKGKQIAVWHSNHNSGNIAIPNEHLWSPGDPFLYDLVVRLKQNGKTIDEVKSYFGMRKISIAKDEKGIDRICLNNKPYFNLGTLDQGFWPDGLYTAPTDESLKFDIQAIKAMGFNTIRKHIKVEPARWYYWADKLGMLVWQDMVNPNQSLPEGAKQEFENGMHEEMEQLHNYPCITTWVLFNEKWGQYDQERLTNEMKVADPSRIVDGHTGELLYVNGQLRSPSPNAYIGADMTDVHAYPDPMMPIKQDGKAQVVGEFGGIGVFIPDHQWNSSSAWGYIQEKPASLLGKYRIMVQHLKLLEEQGLSGSIYTQPFDVEGEQNGIMTYDREVIKMPFAELRKIHSILNPDANTNVPIVTAKDADLTDPNLKYSLQLDEYLKGNREPAYLKKLAMMASQAGDKDGATMASNDYIATLKEPYSKEDLEYIMQVTNHTTEKGFAIIQQNAESIDKMLCTRQAQAKMMNIIFADKIQAAVSTPNQQPDWNAISGEVKTYGPPGEEIFLRAKFFYYMNAQEWNNYVLAGKDYISKYGRNLQPIELNQFAWTAFEKVNEPELLLAAAEWSKLSTKDKEDPNMLDTQANLLYKAGKKEEAIKLEERAVSISGNPELKATLDKMKSGK